MAIDFMILPMSRYISGDYVTPVMRAAWEQGVSYVVVGPDGSRECPPGQPFGGAQAPERRAAIQEMLREDLQALPRAISGSLWDEQSEAEPRFHRVDPVSYEALVAEAQTRKQRSGLLGMFKRDKAPTSHVTATLFVPCDFSEVTSMSSPFERMTGSVKHALEDLRSNSWRAEAQSAREVLMAALEDAEAIRLPLIVDW